MRIGIYNPYIDSLTGGERYSLTLASHWSKTNRVDLFWDESTIVPRAQKRLDIDLSFVTVVPNVFRSHILKKLLITKQYDVIFIMSDGSIPWSFARYNILHFQMPFERIDSSHSKISRYNAIVYNSEFTKNHMDPKLLLNSRVIYPPVDISIYSPSKKQKIILSVGRFAVVKKHEVLIDAFREGVKRNTWKGWKLVLAGGLRTTDQEYYTFLKRKAMGLPIELHPNIEFLALQNLYRSSSLYWHACGYGESDPLHMEHFGISTVEAMASGAVPLVFDGGGQSEIIRHNINGMLWKTPEQLIGMTSTIVKNQKQCKELSLEAQGRAKDFSVQRFRNDFDQLLMDMMEL